MSIRKIVITMSIVLGLAVGGIFPLSSFVDIEVTPKAMACGDKDKGSTESTDTSDDKGQQTSIDTNRIILACGDKDKGSSDGTDSGGEGQEA